jgi:hypothetical protein
MYQPTPLECPSCSADVDVPEGEQLFQCLRCDAKLRVVMGGTVRSLVILEDVHNAAVRGGTTKVTPGSGKRAGAEYIASARQKRLAEIPTLQRRATAASFSCLALGIVALGATGLHVGVGGGVPVIEKLLALPTLVGITTGLVLLGLATFFRERVWKLEREAASWPSRERL